MSYLRSRKILALLAVCAFCGCQHCEPPSKAENELEEATKSQPANLRLRIRNNCASLLYDLLNDEKNVSKLLIVKRESNELNKLVKAISASAAKGAKILERLARTDRTLDLQAKGLPTGEAATRDAIAKSTTSALLHTKGEDFELKLLLTQVEALNYGAHLAKVAAENEPQPEHAREFSALSSELKHLHEQVIVLVRKIK